MINTRIRLAALLATLIGLSLAPHPTQGQSDQDRVALVDFYTSQGCPLCPSALAFLGELAKRSDVVALTLHVDYWDYLGWTDTMGTKAATERQRAYAECFQQRRVYTPQMVVHGIDEESGLKREVIEGMIAVAKVRPRLMITAELAAPNRLSVTIAEHPVQQFAEVFLALFGDRRRVDVLLGDNAGRAFTTYNVVRELRRVGSFTGEALALELDIPEGAEASGGCAIIVQSAGLDPVLGIARLDLSG